MDKFTTVAALLNSLTATRVPITSIVIDPKENIREPDISTWDVPALAEDIAMRGQTTPAVLHPVKGKLHPLAGFRRCSAVRSNAEKGIIDPSTGQPFDSVLAVVIPEELSIKEQYSLMIDSGNTRLLNKVEVFYAVEKAKDVWDTDGQIAIALRGLLDQQFPVKDPDVLIDDAKYADYRRGVIQNLVTAARSPIPLRDAYVLKLKKVKGHNWPTDKEVRGLYQAFKKEMEADKTNKISRLRPGKEWKKLWAEFVEKKEKDVEAGRTPRALNMMSGDDVSTAKSNASSRTVKMLMDCIKRNLSGEVLATLDSALADLEEGKIDIATYGDVLDKLVPDAATSEDAGLPE